MMAEKLTVTKLRPELTLVLGTDGSGKSTFLHGLQDGLGYGVLEPTSSDEARTFKHANIDVPVNDAFVDDREGIFLRLNQSFDAQIAAMQESVPRIATTGNSLVTLVSHGVMRNLINARNRRPIDDIVTEWAATDSLKPANVVLVHAPQATIQQRIVARQEDGKTDERFWGFNAPYFLAGYQDGLHEAINTLAMLTTIRHQSLDSTALNPDEMIDVFTSNL